MSGFATAKPDIFIFLAKVAQKTRWWITKRVLGSDDPTPPA